jgi:UDP-GlcNAc:undecaprenyl-phosphate/decaprenyl-phosphate GlcNAc-1-phosphate transferase
MKAFLLAGAGLVGAVHDPHVEAGVLLAIALGAGLALLAVDLRERAMLGDSGANVLGFLVGVALFLTLRTWALVVAAAVIVVLHVLAETVTLSRLIDAAPPLRWLDRLGRAEVEEPPRGPDPLIP